MTLKYLACQRVEGKGFAALFAGILLRNRRPRHFDRVAFTTRDGRSCEPRYCG